MPASWSAKDERQYDAILDSCVSGRKHRTESTCKRIAAATVNKRRRTEGRTLSCAESFGRLATAHAGLGALVNVESMNARHPDTFHIAPRAKRNALEPGDYAKLIFREKTCGERPWVKVTDRSGSKRVRYTGIVDNETSCGPSMGTEIDFGPQNVADMMGPRSSGDGVVPFAVGVLALIGIIAYASA